MFLPDIMEAKMAASEQDDDVLPWRQSVDVMKFLDAFFSQYRVPRYPTLCLTWDRAQF